MQNLSPWFLKLCRLITRPAISYGGFIVSMFGLGILCQILTLKEGWPSFSLRNFTEVLLYLHLLACMLYILPKRLSGILLTLLYILFYSLAYIDAFCHYSFDDSISPALLLLLSETNAQEAAEFASHFLATCTLLTPALFIFLYLFIHIGVSRLWKKTGLRPTLLLTDSLSIAYTLWLSASAIVSTPNLVRLARAPFHDDFTSYEAKQYFAFNPATRLLSSTIMLHYINLQTQQCISLAQSLGNVPCSHTSPTIVLIIGESYSKHHAQLYGYMLPSTPHQLERQNSGRLFRFDDVVSPNNYTDHVFKELFSSKTVNEPGCWADAPLFPCVMRAAGYKVAFLSNEFFMDMKLQNGTAAFGINADFFINDPLLSKAMFDFRNTELHTYDEGLLADFESCDLSAPYHLIIFQLRGQHLDYDQRFPESYSSFSPNDYKTLRHELTEQERALIADYDNATLYNDAVVDSICRLFDNKEAIIIYFSDHGEEIYEKGRGLKIRTTQIDSEIARYQYEIPFWIYCTEIYAQQHPEIVAAIDAGRQKRYMTAALPPLINRLASIAGAPYAPRYDLLHEQYDSLRPRILRDRINYDELMKTAE